MFAPRIVQTSGVPELTVTTNPEDEVGYGLSEKLAPVHVCAGCAAKVIVCGPIGTTAFDGDDRALVPIAFVAVTLKV